MRLRDIVIDAIHPASLARFWAEALEGYAVRAYDEVEVNRLAELGLTPETDPSVAVDGPGPSYFFQQTSEVIKSPLVFHRAEGLYLWDVEAAVGDDVVRVLDLGALAPEGR